MFISELSANGDISLSVPHTQLSYDYFFAIYWAR